MAIVTVNSSPLVRPANRACSGADAAWAGEADVGGLVRPAGLAVAAGLAVVT
jgi:hypothetical protein